MPNFLWSFKDSVSNGTSTTTPSVVALPKIDPASRTPTNFSVQGASTTTSLINVVRDFYWTYSPVGDVARAEVPRIILTERKLRTNALISQLKYSLGQAYSGGSQTLQNIEQFSTSSGAPGLAKFIQGLATGTQQAVQSGLTTINNTKVGAQVTEAIGNALSDDNNPTVNSSPWLAPYRNLYLTDPTGWVYVLPYFTNNQASQGNNFSDEGKTGVVSDAVLGAVAGLATEAAGLVASLNNPTQITYIEKAKFYNYPTDGESVTVEFPLINTGSVTYDDIVRNWQFLFLLLYQNRPGKTSQNTVDQPVIYQVEVPGTKFFPFCFIQSLNIEFMGSRRELIINVPSNTTTSSDLGAAGQSLNSQVGSIPVSTIIPDAYKVTITLQSMIANSKNFMQHMISNHNLVETGTSIGNAVPGTGGVITAPSQINIASANSILNGFV
jgi:hypothetical protein